MRGGRDEEGPRPRAEVMPFVRAERLGRHYSKHRDERRIVTERIARPAINHNCPRTKAGRCDKNPDETDSTSYGAACPVKRLALAPPCPTPAPPQFLGRRRAPHRRLSER